MAIIAQHLKCVMSSTSAWQLYDGSIELMTDDKQGTLYL